LTRLTEKKKRIDNTMRRKKKAIGPKKKEGNHESPREHREVPESRQRIVLIQEAVRSVKGKRKNSMRPFKTCNEKRSWLKGTNELWFLRPSWAI